MSDHFQVHPDSLAGLSGDFTVSADELATATAAFAGGIADVGQAFGLLGVCDGIAGKYLELTQHTITGLGQLEALLRSDATGLTSSQTAYHAVDAHNSALFKGVAG
ncbi:type VII secretion target [Streptacidiphilus carbonis]|jgi:hypothetical protein|uniref:type VII secretion target n=1 Tax=Streptacidiphilus carbonis TaxID=105422 RepID=UPI0005AB9084|nr:type VII secretion target [Streptacidiphilus carbonis]